MSGHHKSVSFETLQENGTTKKLQDGMFVVTVVCYRMHLATKLN